VLEQVAADLGARANASYSYGTQYLNLGYIPGGPVGLLQFAAIAWLLPMRLRQ